MPHAARHPYAPAALHMNSSAPASRPGSDIHPKAEAVVLFDGHCGLCSATVAWIIRHDPDGRIAFAPLQSARAGELILSAGSDPAALPDSMVVIRDGALFVESEAALAILALLRQPWRSLTLLRHVPRGWRDFAYRALAKRRFRLRARQEQCIVPTPDIRARFLE